MGRPPRPRVSFMSPAGTEVRYHDRLMDSRGTALPHWIKRLGVGKVAADWRRRREGRERSLRDRRPSVRVIYWLNRHDGEI